MKTWPKTASKLLKCSFCRKIKEHLFTVVYFLCKSINTKEVMNALKKIILRQKDLLKLEHTVLEPCLQPFCDLIELLKPNEKNV